MSHIALIVLVALAASRCEAGLLKTFGKGSENLGVAINQGAIKVEDQLTGLFSGGGKKHVAQKPEEPKPVAPKLEESAPAVPAVPAEPPVYKPMLPIEPIDIVYGQRVSEKKPVPPNVAATVVTDDDGLEPEPAVKSPTPAKDPSLLDPKDIREQIVGAPRCDADETWAMGGCRPKD